jgi:hypothetical protein
MGPIPAIFHPQDATAAVHQELSADDQGFRHNLVRRARGQPAPIAKRLRRGSILKIPDLHQKEPEILDQIRFHLFTAETGGSFPAAHKMPFPENRQGPELEVSEDSQPIFLTILFESC